MKETKEMTEAEFIAEQKWEAYSVLFILGGIGLILIGSGILVLALT